MENTNRPDRGRDDISELIDEFDDRNMIPETTAQRLESGELDGDPREILERILEERR
jgi:hypothetical protein